MKKLLLSVTLITVGFCNAQFGTNIPTTKIGSENSKWTFGGNAGLGGAFGSNGGGTAIYITPRVGYKIMENMEAGLAGNLSWSNSKYFSSTTVGVGPFANYYFGRSFFASAMLQEFFFNQKDKYNNFKYSGNETALYIGGGYMQKMGQHTYMQIGGMYNVLYNSNKSVFGGAFVPNIGIVYGL